MADRETHVANYFETELTAELGPTNLVAEVLSTGGLQSPAFLVIEPDNPNQREVILFDGAFTDTQFRVTSIASRYLEGSAQPGGLTHPAGSVVRSAPLAQHIQDLNDRIDAVGEATVGIPRGVLGYAFRTSRITGLSGGPVDLPDLSVQVTVPAGRVLRVVGYVRAWDGAMVQGEEANLLVREGNDTLGLRRLIAPKNGVVEGSAVQALILPSAGTHTYKLGFEQVTGASNWEAQATPAVPAYILVEDIGNDPNA